MKLGSPGGGTEVSGRSKEGKFADCRLSNSAK
jgi:hypothetical protein